MTSNNKFQVLKRIRKNTVDSLLTTLEKAINMGKISELEFKNIWLENLEKNPEIFSKGWYDPPPDGVIVLFGDEKNVDRVSPKSIRPEQFWPKENVYLNKERGLAFLYASPVDRQTGIIGDFGLSIYFGNDPKIRDHYKKSYESVLEIFQAIEVGMKFKDIAKLGKRILASRGLSSMLSSPSDPTGTNIGHSLVGIIPEWTEDELKMAETDWDSFKELIRTKRIFINEIEEFEVKPGMAFTLEPRPESLIDSSLPMVYFHIVVLIQEDGKKELLNEFGEIFKLVGMDYLL